MARQMSAEEYRELGRNFYKLKEYGKALETFTKGIENCSKPTVSLYDYRAATYDKLERFSDAVKDGREMIRLNKADVKGYLRTGSVLEKMGKEETALGIYKYGLKNISAKDQNFKLLQQLHNKLTRKLSPAASIDPFSVLPKELAEMVLAYLPFRQIVNCMRVSKGWHMYLSRLPKLWMHLDLRGARKPVPRSFVNTAFKYSDLRMTSVTLHRFDHMDVIRNLARAAKGLAEVEIISMPHVVSASLVDIAKNSHNLKKLVVHPNTTEDAMEQIFAARPELEHVAFHALLHTEAPISWTNKTLSHLHTLSLSRVTSSVRAEINLGKLLELTPSLQSLTLCNVGTLQYVYQTWTSNSSMPPLTRFILKRVVYDLVLHLPATLEHLVIENISGMQRAFPNDPHYTDSPIPNLTHLSLSGFGLDPIKIGWLLDSHQGDDSSSNAKKPVNGKPLQHLSLRGCFVRDDATLFRGPNNILCHSPRILTPTLESLDLGAMPVNDDDVEHLLTFDTTGLTDIDLSDTNVTGASVKMLVDKLPKLRHVRVDNCTRISGRDAIEYAERKRVSVSYRMGEKKGAKRVRYG